ncbi:phage tail protein [Xanthomonas citri pv. malvacearum]|uniref:Phage tail protein n=1 Tax=Xanthomonas campestris pv. malvacearum TaxID=86040 RepID=A0AA44Z2C4_XANCM|nr:tail fiber protein [Xanthomonas citri]OOW63749.1 phage tail protein [Xanthomonas campestris pv. thespesiae]OOW82203.1 phage tail protein [Xanthomonas campestris pv. leeana]AOL17944.1 phage tail protein [Xanthomonas citri pv. malvacearum]ASM99349.1 phage tail protein [Xanthomonas citri pv. malvacearum]ASN07570.1 phage tail protein [Xanthomonas citri pv. malvacearum]
MNETEAFVGEIRLFPIDWAPAGWLPCDGRTLPITSNVALASLLGTQFGGDGKTTFNLPDLRGRTPVSQGVNPLTTPPVSYTVGTYGGLEGVALTATQVPPHTHMVNAVAAAATTAAVASNANVLHAETPTPQFLYAPTGALIPLAGDSVSQEGAGTAHNNMQPSLVLNFCICTVGIYPQRP